MRFKDIDEVTQARLRRTIRLRKFVLASQDRVQALDQRLVARFMKSIFSLDEYLITDESRLSDFATTDAALARLKRRYGLTADRGAYLVEVLERLAQAGIPHQRPI